WKNIRFFTGFLLAIAAIFLVFSQGMKSEMVGDPHAGYVALVRLDGEIAPGAGFSAQAVLPLLDDAFSDKKAKGVILDINSPGGTPVQAAIIHDAILRLKK